MTNRKAKRILNESDDWVLFTSKKKGDYYEMVVSMNRDEAWEVLLQLAIDKYHIRETFRNIINITDEHLKDNQDSSESE